MYHLLALPTVTVAWLALCYVSGRFRVHFSIQLLTTVTAVICGFPQTLQTNAGIVP